MRVAIVGGGDPRSGHGPADRARRSRGRGHAAREGVPGRAAPDVAQLGRRPCRSVLRPRVAQSTAVRAGMTLLREYCAERAIPYDECGKLVIATDESEMERFEALEERARTNGVPDLRRVDAAELRAIEPAATGIAALHSPRTAVVDFRKVAEAYAQDAQTPGIDPHQLTGATRYSAPRVTPRSSSKTVRSCAQTAQSSAPACTLTVSRRPPGSHSSPGSCRSAASTGRCAPTGVTSYAVSYLSGPRSALPVPRHPSHAHDRRRRADRPERDSGHGSERYHRNQFNARDTWNAVGWPGAMRLFRRYWRVGAAEMYRTLSKRAFVHEAQRYVPTLQAADAVRAPAGARAQAIDADGSLVDDFRLLSDGPVLWVATPPPPPPPPRLRSPRSSWHGPGSASRRRDGRPCAARRHRRRFAARPPRAPGRRVKHAPTVDHDARARHVSRRQPRVARVVGLDDGRVHRFAVPRFESVSAQLAVRVQRVAQPTAPRRANSWRTGKRRERGLLTTSPR